MPVLLALEAFNCGHVPRCRLVAVLNPLLLGVILSPHKHALKLQFLIDSACAHPFAFAFAFAFALVAALIKAALDWLVRGCARRLQINRHGCLSGGA